MLKRLLVGVLGAWHWNKTGSGPADVRIFLQRALDARKSGAWEAAEAALREGIAIHPSNDSLHVLLAELLRATNRDDEALAEYERALALGSQQPEIRFNYAATLECVGDHLGAVRVYREVIEERPDWDAPYLNCGFVECKRDQYESALALFERAIALAPDLAQAHAGAGMAAMKLGDLPEAIQHCQRVLNIDPRNGAAFQQLCTVQYEIGDHQGLRATLAGHQDAASSADGASIARALALPSLLDSRQEIQHVRTRLSAEIAELGRRELKVTDPSSEIGMTSFNLAYQGEDDRDLHERIASLHLHACPGLAYVAAHCARSPARADERIRVGIVSAYLHDHSIGRVMQGLFARFDRERVSVHGFAFQSTADPVYRAMTRDADQWTTLPRELAAAREAIAAARLDVLLYPDIGMDPLTYFLAFARLAPVQCTTWGHPITSGVPALDYFISTDYFEPDGADLHYSERLVRLEDVAMPGYYSRPYEAATAVSPAPGFDRGRRVYFCPQMLFKFHPDFDAILADILRRDSDGEIVITHRGAYDRHRLQRLQARLQRSAGDVYDRMVFLPRTQAPDGYLQRLRGCDVVLDTIQYGGGNTSLEAISAGALVVTLPAAFQRGRHTYGFFRKMRFTDTVVRTAEDYAQLAVRIATDEELRVHLKAEQQKRAAALYEDQGAVRQIEDFFERALAAAGSA